jgi:hypothetical protein
MIASIPSGRTAVRPYRPLAHFELWIPLTYGPIANLPQPNAVLLSKLENHATEVAIGQELRVRGKTYKVTSIAVDGVTISDEREVQTRLPLRQ